MIDRLISSDLDISQAPVLIGMVGLLVWAFAEWLLGLLALHQPRATQRERLSFCWLNLSWGGAIGFSFLDAAALHWTTISPELPWIRYAGIPLLGVGIAIRMVSRLTLARQFSGYVQTTDGHRLITSGIYGSVRHPAYLGYCCLLIGFGMCFGSVGGFGCAIVSGIPALIYRIHVEEAALMRWFGQEYRDYQKRSARLIPRLW